MASLLLFLYIPKILKNLNKWWRGCSSLKYAILYVKRCARGGIVQEVVQASNQTSVTSTTAPHSRSVFIAINLMKIALGHSD